jgi:hypothetical protein
MSRRRVRKLSGRGAVVLAAAILVVSVSLTSAYASSATGPRGGEGGAGISGYTVSGVGFDLGTGSTVSAVHFNLAPRTARTVQIQVATDGAWLACTVANGGATCPVPAGTQAAALDQLSVVAT